MSLAVPRAAAGIAGLDVVSESTFTPYPEEGVVRVVSTFVITNEKPDRVTETSTVRYYFDRFPLLVPNSAANFVATVDGTAATVSVDAHEEDPNAKIATVALPRSIWLGESAEIELTYSLVGGLARDPSAWVRVNRAYVAFPVWVCCDPGQASLRIEMPEAFEVNFNGAGPPEAIVEGEPVYVVESVDDPADYFVMAYGRRDAGLISEIIDVGDARVTLSAWPDDPQWLEFARREVAAGLPALSALVGLSVDLDSLQLVETMTPYLYGYAGWFDTETNVIEVGEDLDPRVVLHELAHIWFNRGLFEERWMNEGFAEVFANAALAKSGRPIGAPTAPEPLSAASIPLSLWVAPTGGSGAETRELEEFGYSASWFVVDALAREVGVDGLAAVIEAVDRGEISYPPGSGGDPEEFDDQGLGWRRLLDLLEERAGSAEADGLFRAHVVPPADLVEIDERTRAREQVSVLASASGSWDIPYGVRASLSRWEIDETLGLIEHASAVLAARDALEAAVDLLDLARPADPEPAYEQAETSSDLDAVAERLHRLTDATEVVAGAAAAVERDFGFWTDWGLRGVDLVDEYQDVRDAFAAGDVDLVQAEAAEIDALVSEAAGKAKRFWGAVAAVSLVVLGVVAASIMGVRRRRRRQRLAALTIPDPVDSPDYGAADGAVEPVSSPHPSLVGARHARSGDPQYEAHEDERGPDG